MNTAHILIEWYQITRADYPVCIDRFISKRYGLSPEDLMSRVERYIDKAAHRTILINGCCVYAGYLSPEQILSL